jgi:hypothetical protein
MKNSDYIIPTKEHPVFLADCDYIGYIDGTYKKHLLGNCSSDTFGIDFAKAVNDLHEWIKEHSHLIEEYPKCKFNLYISDGSLDKYDDAIRKKVYTISARKAKKLLM